MDDNYTSYILLHILNIQFDYVEQTLNTKFLVLLCGIGRIFMLNKAFTKNTNEICMFICKPKLWKACHFINTICDDKVDWDSITLVSAKQSKKDNRNDENI